MASCCTSLASPCFIFVGGPFHSLYHELNGARLAGRETSIFLSADVEVLHGILFNAPSASSAAAAQVITSLPTHIVSGTAILCGSPGGPACAAEPLAKAATESTMEFLPLMLTSLYCSVGIIWAWLRLSVIYLWT